LPLIAREAGALDSLADSLFDLAGIESLDA
jgi:hypothetical protein